MDCPNGTDAVVICSVSSEGLPDGVDRMFLNTAPEGLTKQCQNACLLCVRLTESPEQLVRGITSAKYTKYRRAMVAGWMIKHRHNIFPCIHIVDSSMAHVWTLCSSTQYGVSQSNNCGYSERNCTNTNVKHKAPQHKKGSKQNYSRP